MDFQVVVLEGPLQNIGTVDGLEDLLESDALALHFYYAFLYKEY
jgi:hypothetical protein